MMQVGQSSKYLTTFSLAWSSQWFSLSSDRSLEIVDPSYINKLKLSTVLLMETENGVSTSLPILMLNGCLPRLAGGRERERERGIGGRREERIQHNTGTIK